MPVYIVNTIPDDEYMGNGLFLADSPEEAIDMALKDENLRYRFRANLTNLAYNEVASEQITKFIKGESDVPIEEVIRDGDPVDR